MHRQMNMKVAAMIIGTALDGGDMVHVCMIVCMIVMVMRYIIVRDHRQRMVRSLRQGQQAIGKQQ